MDFAELEAIYGNMDEVEYLLHELGQLEEKIARLSQLLTVCEILGWISLGLSLVFLASVIIRETQKKGRHGR